MSELAGWRDRKAWMEGKTRDGRRGQKVERKKERKCLFIGFGFGGEGW